VLPPGLRRVTHAVGAAGVGATAALIVALLGGGLGFSAQWWARWVFPVLGLGAAVMVLLRACLVARRWPAWMIVGFGLLCSASGDVLYSLTGFGEPAGPAPTPSDALWLGSYLAFYLGTGLLVRAGARHFHASMWLDGLGVTLGFAALSSLALDVLLVGAGRPADFALLLSYPLLDLAFTALVVGIWAVRGWPMDGPWAPLAGAGAATTVADTGYLFLVTAGTLSRRVADQRPVVGGDAAPGRRRVAGRP
jgi:hypothetical protein